MSGIYQTSRQWMNGNGQALVIGTASATNSAALPKAATAVRLVSSVDCVIEFGPVASASNSTGGYLPAFTPEYFPLSSPGPLSTESAGIQIQAMSLSSDGTLWIKPLVG